MASTYKLYYTLLYVQLLLAQDQSTMIITIFRAVLCTSHATGAALMTIILVYPIFCDKWYITYINNIGYLVYKLVTFL